ASGVDALLSTSSTRSRPPLLKSWEVQPCRVDDALSHDDFSSSYAMPECHYVRRIGRAQLAGDVRFAPALAWAAQHRVGVPETFYEIRYARYANDGFIDATMLIAAPRLNSDDGAIAWGSQFSSAMRPLGRSGSAHAALPTIQ
ncbi:MAG TPA: hypothetical protein VM491_02250, partial [Burkholderiaceae bacterium]|nr:hypothetical protein [Burkholderiaceae bacterium]